MADTCEKCGKELKQKPRWSACDCLPARMRCSKCKQVVPNTGWDSDGFGWFQHEPCGLVMEDEMIDVRTEAGVEGSTTDTPLPPELEAELLSAAELGCDNLLPNRTPLPATVADSIRPLLQRLSAERDEARREVERLQSLVDTHELSERGFP